MKELSILPALPASPYEEELRKEIANLQSEIERLKKASFSSSDRRTVNVPYAFKPIFDEAEKTVGAYFKRLNVDPGRGTIEISGQRYVLVRASALSHDFLQTFKEFYSDRGEQEAFLIGKNFLFDIAHLIGMDDAKSFHQKMRLKDPIAKLSAGPIHFAYSGWAFVDILPESNPSPDENFFLKYNHPYSFEADSWIESEIKSDFPVCIMSCGYSSGWCEESFGIPLTAVEISCRAQGDENCTFIMAPPQRMYDYLKHQDPYFFQRMKKGLRYEVPTFFERKLLEEKLVEQAKRDYLTGLYNRGAIIEILEREISHSIESQVPLGLVMLDLDHFKEINDKFGHSAGDTVLKEVAQRLTDAVRKNDYVGRYGGEEFMILLNGCDNNCAMQQAERLLESLRKDKIHLPQGDVQLTASCGVIATDHIDLDNLDAFINQVDAELYLAKAHGRNRVELTTFHPNSTNPRRIS